MKKVTTLLLILVSNFNYSQIFLPDSTFNGIGMASATSESTTTYGTCLLYQPDGKIVVAGNYRVPHPLFLVSGFLTYRFNSNGTQDTLYGNSAKTRTKFYSLSRDEVMATALQPDGKIVLAGWANSNFALARYHSNGIIDSLFGNNGKVESLFGSGYISVITILNTGCILVAGKCSGGFALARYLSNGLPDQTFGNGGIVLAGGNLSSPTLSSMVLQTDGKIVIAGQYWDNNTTGYDMAVMRFNANGTVDNSFGANGNGLVALDFGSIEDYCSKLHIRTNGRLVITGTTKQANGNPKFAAAEFLSSGALSTSFGNGGKIIEGDNANLNFLYTSVLLSNNEILIFGESYQNGNTLNGLSIVMKIGSNGQFNYSFNWTGYFHPTLSYKTIHILDVILQPDGKLLVCGSYADPVKGMQLMVSRYKIVNSITTDLQDENPENCFSVFPNPTTNKLFIHTNGLMEYDVALSNSVGKIVYCGHNIKEADISNLPSGIYFMDVRTKNNQVLKTTKIIKN
jgi:uncharacterized delta-60 repeat protein